jgi:hypothetical protein
MTALNPKLYVRTGVTILVLIGLIGIGIAGADSVRQGISAESSYHSSTTTTPPSQFCPTQRTITYNLPNVAGAAGFSTIRFPVLC